MSRTMQHWIGGRNYSGHAAQRWPGRRKPSITDATIDSAAVSGMYFEKLVQIAEEESVCLAKTLAGLGLRRAEFCASMNRYSYRQFYALIQALEDQHRIVGVGLKLGRKEGPLVDGFLGYACSSAVNLRQSLVTYIRFMGELGVDVALSLATEGEVAHLTFAERYPLGRFLRFSVEEILGHFTRVCEHLRGGKLRCTRASFSYEQPAYTQLYEDMLRCPLRFDAPLTRLSFSKADLDLPFLTANETIYRICVSHCEALYRRFATSGALAEEVRRIILMMPSATPRVEEMAQRFHMTPRTFRRCLSGEGTTYHEIVHGARMTVAADYLSHTAASPREISDWVGYQEIASFYRNFKSWAGVTPKQYREREIQR
jgi:AraC-like DNA-binding protein